MDNEVYEKRTSKLLLVAAGLGLGSLVCPWWNLIVVKNGQLFAYFGSHLWGIVTIGFLRSDFPYQWWSYITLVLILTGCFSGLPGYKSLKASRKRAQALVVLGMALTLAGCTVYLVGFQLLLMPASNRMVNPWMISNGHETYRIAINSFFRFSVPLEGIIFSSFLSLGFFLAAIQVIFSIVAMLRLIKPKAHIKTPT